MYITKNICIDSIFTQPSVLVSILGKCSKSNVGFTICQNNNDDKISIISKKFFKFPTSAVNELVMNAHGWVQTCALTHLCFLPPFFRQATSPCSGRSTPWVMPRRSSRSLQPSRCLRPSGKTRTARADLERGGAVKGRTIYAVLTVNRAAFVTFTSSSHLLTVLWKISIAASDVLEKHLMTSEELVFEKAAEFKLQLNERY